MFSRIFYRIKQFFRALSPRITEEDKAFVRQYLNIEEAALFDNLTRYQKKHSLAVAKKMLEVVRGSEEVDEKGAVKFSLLHDIGKSAVRFSLFDLVILVIFRKLFRGLYNKLAKKGEGSSSLILRKFYVHKFHGIIGAELLRRAGVSEKIADLVENHDKILEPNDPLELMLLRQLDEKG